MSFFTLFSIHLTSVELSTQSFRDQHIRTFPHHFKLERRAFLYKHSVYEFFDFVNGYLATTHEQSGANSRFVHLPERIKEIYPEW